MGRIKVLDQQTVNEIAAGEVVERPASVVKELIENSIDAGARRIEIRIEQGGTKKIEVIDDGEGMSREDALLAVNQHSTSKLFKIGDLSRLSTYGFRGEALASIGSVSKLTIRTKRNDEAVGTLVIVDFGAPPEVSDTGAPTGTTVIVEDLFSNVPARKKNLPSQQTELAHTESIVTKYAIAWPEVSFDLVSNGKQMLSFRGPDRSSRILELVGPRAAKRLIDFSKEEGQL
ncbi:MAG: DNA mismatch repair endonuclease MutL, partial [Thermoplasmata archaeon]|nr:DNA mismatch repair endonuclease MutL [Thermoplasmata archaeon]